VTAQSIRSLPVVCVDLRKVPHAQVKGIERQLPLIVLFEITPVNDSPVILRGSRKTGDNGRCSRRSDVAGRKAQRKAQHTRVVLVRDRATWCDERPVAQQTAKRPKPQRGASLCEICRVFTGNLKLGPLGLEPRTNRL
jgi:hypothetical protein